MTNSRLLRFPTMSHVLIYIGLSIDLLCRIPCNIPVSNIPTIIPIAEERTTAIIMAAIIQLGLFAADSREWNIPITLNDSVPW